MKAAIFFMFLFNLYAVNAQLFISPSTKSDHFLYVRDRMLYVEKDIKLTENRNKETQASVYLRKEAQLIQGNTSLQNTGSGSISVIQKGSSNAYDYNYWALPVSGNFSHPEIRDFVYEPLGNTESRNAKLISALEGSSSPLSISKRWIYTFSGNTYADWHYAGDHFDLKPGEGFTMKGVNGTNMLLIEEAPVNPGSAHLYDFRGIANNGNIELEIKKDELLLVGNPYPSAMDLKKFLLENTNTTGIAYFWDSRKNGNSHYLSDYEGGYGTYSAGTGIYVPPAFIKYGNGVTTGETGAIFDRNIIPIAQGFMIKGKTPGKLTFKNSHRVYKKEVKGLSEFKSAESGLEALRLDIEFDSMYVRQLALAFKKEATVAEDHSLDARQMNLLPKDASWIIDGEYYNINVRPKVNEELIPLNISLDEASTLKFLVSEWQNFDPDRLFIYDAKQRLYFGIRSGDLRIQLPAGLYNDRFYLSFIEKLPENLVANEPVNPEKKPLKLLNTIDIFQNNSEEQLEIRVLYEAALVNIKLYNLNGKLLFQQGIRENLKEFNFPTGNLGNAVYIVKVKTSDNIELTKKIGVKN